MMFSRVKLSVGRLQSRKAALDEEREAFERRQAEARDVLHADVAEAKERRLAAIRDLNAELAELGVLSGRL